jgi:putative PIN family toxin of toxin-antitoxin system
MPKLGLVLDTNVVVSAHLRSFGFERFAFDLALSSKVRFYVSADIFQEYREVLMRPKFRFPPRMLVESFRLIEDSSVRIRPAVAVYAAADPDDNKFLECAEAAGADYLITGNKRHFPDRWKSTSIVSAREFAAMSISEF